MGRATEQARRQAAHANTIEGRGDRDSQDCKAALLAADPKPVVVPGKTQILNITLPLVDGRMVFWPETTSRDLLAMYLTMVANTAPRERPHGASPCSDTARLAGRARLAMTGRGLLPDKKVWVRHNNKRVRALQT